MEELKKLEDLLKEFSTFIDDPRRSGESYHIDDIANKKFSKILSDLQCVKTITLRLNKDVSTEEINLDIKSFYIFSKILIDSILEFCEFFLNKTIDIRWNSLGSFLQDAEKNLFKQSDDFQKFFNANKNYLKSLRENLEYRNFIIHNKRPNTEWTMTWPGHNNLDFVYIETIVEIGDKKSHKKTNPLRDLLNSINSDITIILSFFRLRLLK